MFRFLHPVSLFFSRLFLSTSRSLENDGDEFCGALYFFVVLLLIFSRIKTKLAPSVFFAESHVTFVSVATGTYSIYILTVCKYVLLVKEQ